MKKYLILLFLPLIVSAHGTVTTLTQTSGNNLLEFEYNTLGNVTAGDFYIYDVYFLDSDKNPIAFDAAFIKIVDSNGSNVLFGNVSPGSATSGTVNLGGVMPTAGNYKAVVQVLKNGQTIGSGQFSFDVIGKTSTPGSTRANWPIVLAVGLVGLVLGAAINKLIKNKNDR